MTEAAAGENLESAGPRWKGGVDWSDDWEHWVRHWWRFHPKEPTLIHRASGEQVAYVGMLKEPGWHRFEYRHEGAVYPIAVQMRRVPWPNPDPFRYAGPPYDSGPVLELRLRVWRIDHIRSADLWRRETALSAGHGISDDPPPYWLWRRVDHAIADAALLWPRRHPHEITFAQDVAVNGGWLNGTWRERFFRRIRRRYDFEDYRPRGSGLSAIPGWPLPASTNELGLPLTDHALEETDAKPPRWERVLEPGIGLDGRKGYRRTLMRNCLDGSLIDAMPCETRDSTRPPAVLISLRDGIAWALPVEGLLREDATREGETQLANCANWTIQMARQCSISGMSRGPGPIMVPWLTKPVLPIDGIGGDRHPNYDNTVINHPLTSYRSWRFLYDCFMNALPFSPGFEQEDFGSNVTQGDVGQLTIFGGFVGGTQQLMTEIRLNLELPSDKDNATWSRFFS